MRVAAVFIVTLTLNDPGRLIRVLAPSGVISFPDSTCQKLMRPMPIRLI